MEETKITITKNGDFNNVNLRENLVVEVEGKKMKTEEYVLDGKYIILEKLFDKVLEKNGKFGEYWIARAKYGGEDVSFFLNYESDFDGYENLGVTGDKIKVSGEKTTTKKGRPFLNLSFELQ